MNDNEFVEYLRHEEDNYLPEPPEGLWNDIESKLPKSAKRGRTVPLWLRIVSVAACVALICGVGTLFLFSPTDKQEQPTAAMVTKDRKAIEEQKGLEEETSDYSTVVATPKRIKAVAEVVTAADAAPQITDTTVDQSQPLPQANHDTKNSEPSKPAKRPVRHSNTDLYLAENFAPQKARRTASLSLFAAGIMANNTQAQSDFMVADGSPNDDEIENTPYGDIVMLNYGQPMETKRHYSLPLRAGIRFAIPLTNTIDIETGLTYTRLASSIESGSNDNYYRTEQTLHYVGIPLRLRCKLWESKRIGVYVNGGGMAEKCVSDDAETKFFIGGNVNETESQSVREHALQFSASLAAGIEAALSQNVSLFVEPGLNYYFDNHSSVDNVYKDRPLNLDLNLGLRINLNK